jgi:1,2-diacylglycerol 3-alpha-glucosyltransferase
MKILLATEAYWPIKDGGSDFERRLVKGLIKRGHEVRVVAPSPGITDVLDQTDGYPIYRPAALRVPLIPTYRFAPLPGSLMRRIVQDFAPDVIHVHNPYGIGRSALRYGKRLGIPVVATNHLMPENLFYNVKLGVIKAPLSALFYRYLIRFHNRADAVTSPTETALRLLTERGLRAPAQAISNGVDVTRFRPGQDAAPLRKKLKLPAKKPVVLYMGRLDREKRLDVWVDAIPHIVKKVDAHFVVGGRGNDKPRLEAQIRALGLQDRVTFTGFIEDDDLPLLYNLADVFAISSPSELQSIVTLEAIASGLPVVSVDAGALPELVRSGENGYLAPVNDPAAFGAAVLKVLQHKDREQLRAASRELALTHDERKTHEHYEALYQKLVEEDSK